MSRCIYQRCNPPSVSHGALQDALGALDTPGGRVKPGERTETPLTDVINRNLKVALANSSRCPDQQALSASPELSKRPEPQVPAHLYQKEKL